MYLIPLAVCIAAALVDLRIREIPNSLSIGVGVLGLVVALLGLTPVSITQCLYASTVTLVLATVVAWRGGVGGGDVKLLTGLAAWLPISGAVALLFWTAVAGLPLAGFAAASGRKDFAYGPAIACGFAIAAFVPTLLPSIVVWLRSAMGVT